jgi:hypothetical protein
MILRIKELTTLNHLVRKGVMIGFSAMALLTVSSAHAANLVTNGGFETTTNGSNFQFDILTAATGWTSSGYNFLFSPGAADTSGSLGQYGNLTLWGPNNGSANGLPASSPDGGNYVGADGAFGVGAISQTITGLTSGNTYTVSFFWAGAQQNGFNGDTTEQWIVSFGGQTQSTAVLNNADHGFTGWQSQSFAFTADGTSDVLSFLAVGTPNGVPPFALLDGVSVSDSAPEPGAFTMVLGGLLSSLGVLKLKKRFTRR